MIDQIILERQIFILASKNADYRMALEEIEAVAVSKKVGAAKRMQQIARRALAVSRPHRGGET